MGTLNVGAAAPGWDSTIRAMQALPRDVKREVARNGGRELAEPLAREIRTAGRSQGSHAGAAADTVQSGMRSGVPVVKAGGKLPFTQGAEWGGGIRRRTYWTRSPRGTRYVVTLRHTTAQFRPWRRQGYWFWGTVNTGRGADAVMRAWRDVVDRVLREL